VEYVDTSSISVSPTVSEIKSKEEDEGDYDKYDY